MDTYRGLGDTVLYTNPTSETIAASDVVVLPDMIGIAIADIPAGEEGVLAVAGDQELDADGAWDVGTQLYWDETNAELTETASSNTPAGKAAADKPTADTTARVLLNR